MKLKEKYKDLVNELWTNDVIKCRDFPASSLILVAGGTAGPKMEDVIKELDVTSVTWEKRFKQCYLNLSDQGYFDFEDDVIVVDEDFKGNCIDFALIELIGEGVIKRVRKN